MQRLPRAILFDLDDTIIAAYGRADLAWAAVVAGFEGALGPEAPLLAAIGETAAAFWSDPERHRIWRQKMAAARREIVAQAFGRLAAEGAPVPQPALQQSLADRFSRYRNENIRLFPDAHDTLAALRARGIRLALVTNGAAEHQREKIERFGLAPHFDHIQIEGEHGFGKPEARAYHHAMGALGVQAHETWMVGDNLEWEVVAPQKLGIHAVWYDPDGKGVPAGHPARPDRIICKLAELLD